MIKKLFIPALIIFFIIAISLLTKNSQPRSQEPIKLGFIGPLTGEVANIGIPARAAAEIAVEEINSKGGINGRTISLTEEDSKCDPKEAMTVGKKLIEVEKVVAIVGAGCSGETLAIAPTAEQNKVIMVSYVSSNPKITEAGDYIFRVFPSDSFQGKVGAQYAYANLGKKAVIVYTNNDYGKGIQEVFSKMFKQLGGEILTSEAVAPESTDVRSVVTKVKQMNPDVIYAPLQKTESIAFLKQLKEQGIETKLLGADIWDDQILWKTAGSASDGIMFTTSATPDASEEFMSKLKSKLGDQAAISSGTLQAYDAVMILAKAIEKAGVGPKQLKNELYKTTLSGISSPNIAFDENGDLQKAEYTVKRVQNGNATEEK